MDAGLDLIIEQEMAAMLALPDAPVLRPWQQAACDDLRELAVDCDAGRGRLRIVTALHELADRVEAGECPAALH